MKTKLQLTELEIYCLVQALRVVETKDNVEREKLSVTFEQLKLLEYDAKFASSTERTYADLQSVVADFEVEEFVPEFLVKATENVNVKGPFQINMGMLSVTKKAKAALVVKKSADAPSQK